jgi:hypothetical protein
MEIYIMSTYSQFLGGGGKFRYQTFTASGTFTPSASLLANGGQVMLEIRGGGGGSGGYYGAYPRNCGGNSKHVAPYTVTGVTTVIVGAGGASGTGYSPGAVGGTSSFGTLSIAGGGGGYNLPGIGSGNEGTSQPVSILGANYAWTGGAEYLVEAATYGGGTGAGGGNSGYYNGWSGIVVVTWFE